ncbi:MAG: orotate phosphoribosyltransferase [Magnetococcales bacterium]|nr:orotate phosphoribosyltransferase [Magnetococcales bacterium]MBF0149882.1 orotate phosphoribosyltransferase [Magnetococcales bacterium]MBF0631864.1 orotate phosphoribosyltransferase [Magnetococcales bacterium]
MNSPSALSLSFLRFALNNNVLRFGRFTTKAGRETPYFFDAGLFNTGAQLETLGRFYADAIWESKLPFTMLFGPAYKGIALATTTATALSRYHDMDCPIAFNRKEAKDHGEGGRIIGSPLTGRVLIVDDVISAGTSVREAADWIRAAGADLAGVVIALDRQERGRDDERSATQQVEETLGIPVIAISRLDDLVQLLKKDSGNADRLNDILAYRDRHGAR